MIIHCIIINYIDFKGLSVCRSGHQDPVDYSLLGGGVPYPEHRLHWSIDSVPYIRFLCFTVGDGLVPSFLFPTSKIHPGSLLCKHSCLLSLFILSASSPPVYVYSADPLQCLFPTLSVPPRPSVGKLPTLRIRSTNVFSCFPSPASHMQVCSPPRPVRLVVLGLVVGGGSKETAPPAMVLSPSTRRQASPGRVACLFQHQRSSSLLILAVLVSLSAPPPPIPLSPYNRTCPSTLQPNGRLLISKVYFSVNNMACKGKE